MAIGASLPQVHSKAERTQGFRGAMALNPQQFLGFAAAEA
jgi:hypothetical protein